MEHFKTSDFELTDVIDIKSQNGVLTVNSREVAERFEKRHDSVLRDIDNLISNIEPPQNCGDLFIEDKYQHKQNKQIYREFLITRDGFTLLAMGFTGKKALHWKLKYIEAFNRMEEELKSQNQVPQIDSKFMFQIAQQLEEKEKQIQVMKPKALFADAVATSKSSVLVGELAKVLKQNNIDIGQNRMFEWLRSNTYLMSRKGESWNMPTQKSMDLELFEIKVRTIVNPDGSIRTTKTTKVTGKGQIYFVNKFSDLQQLKIVNA